MAVDPTRLVPEICERCGDVFNRAVGRKMHRCFKCRREQLVENIDAQHSKVGPTYENNVRKSLAFWKGEAKRLKMSA